MVAAPTVQSLSQIMAELEPAYKQQTGLVEAKQAGLGEKYAAQQKGLEAQRASEFDTISNQAVGRGMAFSGIPLNEQARYTSTAFLPAMANLKTSQNEESAGLQKELADIYSNRYNQAFSTRGTQQSALNAWNQSLMQNEFSAAEAEKQRQFEAAQNAANRAASAAANYTPQPSLTANIRAYLDQYVDPKTGTVPLNIWKNAVARAYESGMSFAGNEGFASKFWNYADDKNWEAYKKGYSKFI